jgi:hypothetical protein
MPETGFFLSAPFPNPEAAGPRIHTDGRMVVRHIASALKIISPHFNKYDSVFVVNNVGVSQYAHRSGRFDGFLSSERQVIECT